MSCHNLPGMMDSSGSLFRLVDTTEAQQLALSGGWAGVGYPVGEGLTFWTSPPHSTSEACESGNRRVLFEWPGVRDLGARSHRGREREVVVRHNYLPLLGYGRDVTVPFQELVSLFYAKDDPAAERLAGAIKSEIGLSVSEFARTAPGNVSFPGIAVKLGCDSQVSWQTSFERDHNRSGNYLWEPTLASEVRGNVRLVFPGSTPGLASFTRLHAAFFNRLWCHLALWRRSGHIRKTAYPLSWVVLGDDGSAKDNQVAGFLESLRLWSLPGPGAQSEPCLRSE